MAYDLTNTLVIGISSTALFNMQESDNLFKEFCSSNPEKAIEQYRDYMLLHENDELLPGTGFPLVEALLGLNKYKKEADKSPLVEGNDSNLLIVFYVQIMPDDFVMQLHRF